MHVRKVILFVFFFNDTATTEIYTLSLHDALPICAHRVREPRAGCPGRDEQELQRENRKSTRLNSSHGSISYAVFCLQQKPSEPNASHGRTSAAAVSFEHTHHHRA